MRMRSSPSSTLFISNPAGDKDRKPEYTMASIPKSTPTKSSVSAPKVSQSPYSMPIHTLGRPETVCIDDPLDFGPAGTAISARLQGLPYRFDGHAACLGSGGD